MSAAEDSSPFPAILGRQTLCVVTGASRGIGKEVAVQLADHVGGRSAFLLLARNSEELQRTKEDIRNRNASIHVETLTLDLARFADHGSAFDTPMNNFLHRSDKYDVAMIVHNAGTLGPIDKPVHEFSDASEIRDYFEMNFVSFVLLNNAFLRAVSEHAQSKVVVNVTSLLAIKGLPGFGMYGAGKAAREGFVRCLAAENPQMRILNYSPGPVATDMQDKVAEESWDENTREFSKKLRDDFELVTCQQTVRRLIQLLQQNRFTNGDHVDYYDDQQQDVARKPLKPNLEED